MNPPPNFTDMTRSATRHFSGVSLNASLGAALVAVALAGIIVLSGAASVISSAFAGSIKDDRPKEVIDDLVAQHDAKMKEFQERFKQRYVFFKPPPPPPPPRRDEPKPEEPVVIETPKDTGPPATYPGPSIMWVIGDDVYFNDPTPTQTQKYLRVKVGEEKEGVKVINVDNVPRTVRVGHSGGEYDVKVFGDTMAYAPLFPADPRPSILNPGLIPVGQPAAPVAATEPEAAPIAVEGAAAAENPRSPRGGRLAATPVREERGRGRDRDKDAEARKKAEESGEKPPAEAQPENQEGDEPADDPQDADGDGVPDEEQQEQPQTPPQQPTQEPKPGEPKPNSPSKTRTQAPSRAD